MSFRVDEGESFGIIGPNGAGKTTTVECISGLRAPDSGMIRVLGLDPQGDRAAIRERVGVQLKESALLATAAMLAIGLLIAALARSPQIAAAVGTVLLYPLLFFAGMWTPKQNMALALQHVGNYTPLDAAVHTMDAAMQGHFPPARPLLVMASYAVVFGIAAIRMFRWE